MSKRMRRIIAGLMKGASAALIFLGGYLSYNILTSSENIPLFTMAASFLLILLLILGILGLLS
ncbi:MAG: hypothetical protein N3F65_03690 [Nitrososphaeria archaeon]|nr:hypothetical protein [Aigarchaeota archaeon]MCX8187694.1 hypothetical protein [Nitrososphaeria archaeon]